MIIETCCITLEEALEACRRGAGRIELCADLTVGGVTPPHELIKSVVRNLPIPVNVLIRAHAPGFICDEQSLRRMTSDIEFCKSVGVSGIVIGALTPDGSIDILAMERLMLAARPLPVTFHRAFDECKEDPFPALEKIIGLGCARLLTSGMKTTAWEGRNLVAELVRRASGRIVVMPGCGVRPDNLAALEEITGATEFHGTKIPGPRQLGSI